MTGHRSYLEVWNKALLMMDIKYSRMDQVKEENHVKELINHDNVHFFKSKNAIDPEWTLGHGRNPEYATHY